MSPPVPWPTIEVDGLMLTRPSIEAAPMHMTPAPEWVAWAELVMRLVWVATAAVVAGLMARRGHDRGWWAIVGLILGPAAFVAAFVAARRARRRGPLLVAPGRAGAGITDVIFVIDPADPTEGLANVDIAWPPLRRVVFVTVIGRDTFDLQARQGDLRRARAALGRAAAAAPFGGAEPQLVVLEGRPDDAVTSFALGHQLRLVLVPSTPGLHRLGPRLARTRALIVARTGTVFGGPERVTASGPPDSTCDQ